MSAAAAGASSKKARHMRPSTTTQRQRPARITSLQSRLSGCQQAHNQSTVEVQQAARAVAAENERLLELAIEHGLTADDYSDFVASFEVGGGGVGGAADDAADATSGDNILTGSNLMHQTRIHDDDEEAWPSSSSGCGRAPQDGVSRGTTDSNQRQQQQQQQTQMQGKPDDTMTCSQAVALIQHSSQGRDSEHVQRWTTELGCVPACEASLESCRVKSTRLMSVLDRVV